MSRQEQGDASGNNERGENDSRQSDESSQERQDNQDPAGIHMRVFFISSMRYFARGNKLLICESNS